MTEPKIVFGTTDTILFKDEITNDMIITNNNTNVLVISENMRIGINQDTPAETLDVNGNIQGNNYKINTNTVLSENSLGIGITSSNLQTLGILENINVTGEVVGQSLKITGDSQINGDLNIDGDLNVTGTMTTSNTVITTVNQNLIKLSNDNTSNLLDSGFYSMYIESGTTKFRGLYDDTSENTFKLFTDLESEPSTTVNNSHASYNKANLEVNDLNTNDITANDINNTNINASNNIIGENLKITSNTDLIGSLNVDGDVNINNNNLVVDTIFDRVGINMAEPQYLLDVSGIVNSNEYKLNGTTVFNSNEIGNGITISNLEELGTLNSLNVGGNATIQNLTVTNIAQVKNLGIGKNANVLYSIDTVGDIHTETNYQINETIVLSEDTLGNNVKNSNLESVGTLNNLKITETGSLLIGIETSSNKIDITNGDINIYDGDYKIDNEVILSKNNLGLSVTSSNLQEFGDINSLSITGYMTVRDLSITGDKVMIATEFKKQALNVSGNIAVYNTDTSDLDIVHLGGSGNYTDFQQIIGSLNYKTDVGGGYVTTLNPENMVTDVAKIKVQAKTGLNNTNQSAEFIFENIPLNSTSIREVARIKEDGRMNIINSYQINGVDVISPNSLGPAITSSNIQQFGDLVNLSVSGNCNIIGNLDITGDTTIHDGVFYDNNGITYPFSNWSISDTQNIYNLSNNIGLNVTNPSEKLQIDEGNIMLGTTIATNDTKGIIKFNKIGAHTAIECSQYENLGTKIYIDDVGSGIHMKTGGSGFIGTDAEVGTRSGTFKISNYDSDLNDYKMVLKMDTTGYIGINTTTPSAELDVNGTVKINALNITGNLDVDGTLNVADSTYLQSTLTVINNTNLNAALTVANGTNLQSTLTVANNT
ncbi:uncharacterized protein METZ01_LOCUS45596, partial [marine metagenome]